jgi:antitoxin MazE
MITNITTIGNSKGIRIPKIILEELDFRDKVELEVKGDCLIIRPVRQVREGWSEDAKLMHEAGDDELIGGDLTGLIEFDQTEWEWDFDEKI